MRLIWIPLRRLINFITFGSVDPFWLWRKVYQWEPLPKDYARGLEIPNVKWNLYPFSGRKYYYADPIKQRLFVLRTGPNSTSLTVMDRGNPTRTKWFYDSLGEPVGHGRVEANQLVDRMVLGPERTRSVGRLILEPTPPVPLTPLPDTQELLRVRPVVIPVEDLEEQTPEQKAELEILMDQVIDEEIAAADQAVNETVTQVMQGGDLPPVFEMDDDLEGIPPAFAFDPVAEQLSEALTGDFSLTSLLDDLIRDLRIEKQIEPGAPEFPEELFKAILSKTPQGVEARPIEGDRQQLLRLVRRTLKDENGVLLYKPEPVGDYDY